MRFLFLIFLTVTTLNAFVTDPKGRLVRVTREHELTFERDTVLVKHWHKVGEKFYVIKMNGIDFWCDDVEEIDTAKGVKK